MNDNNFSELIQYLDNKFVAVDKRFDEMKGDFNNLLSQMLDRYMLDMV